MMKMGILSDLRSWMPRNASPSPTELNTAYCRASLSRHKPNPHLLNAAIFSCSENKNAPNAGRHIGGRIGTLAGRPAGQLHRLQSPKEQAGPILPMMPRLAAASTGYLNWRW